VADVRAVIARLGLLGPLPEEDADIADGVLERYDDLLRRLVEPLHATDAEVVAGLFPQSACFGMEWTLVHLLENSEGWPSTALQAVNSARWSEVLSTRLDSRI
jgi:hypothetical protein